MDQRAGAIALLVALLAAGAPAPFAEGASSTGHDPCPGSSPPYRSAEAAGLIAHQDAPANPVVKVASTSASSSSNGPASSDRQAFVSLDAPAAVPWARLLESRASAEGDRSWSRAFAEANASRLSLHGGAVTAEAVHVEAHAASDGTLATDGYVHDLRIHGEPLLLPPGPARVDVPGVGTLHVMPTEVRTGEHPAALIHGLVLHVRTPAHHATVMVGLAAVAHGCGQAPPPLTAWRDDDAASGGDAPDAPEGIPLALPAVVSGRVGGEDAADAYEVTTQGEGHTLVVVLKASERVVADLAPIPIGSPVGPITISGSNPAAIDEASLTPLRVELLDPAGIVRESRDTPLTGPLVFEHNVHVGGAWSVRVLHAGERKVNYTLAIDDRTYQRVGGEGTVSAADVPPACGAGHLVAPGAHVGGLYGADRADALRFKVDAGDAIVATMKPGESADGARFGLRLYDPTCAERAAAAWDPSRPEGTPRVVSHLAADRAGDWTLVIERQTEAVGNWHLVLHKEQPMPPVFSPDAGTGADAGGTPSTGIVVGNALHQGRVTAGDDVDCYRFQGYYGEIVSAAAMPSPGLDVRLRLISPVGEMVVSNTPAHEAAVFLVGGATGLYAACIDRLSGGGQYVIATKAEGRP